MKFLILAALVAVASADYHDDTFHFSTLGSVTGLKRSSFVQAGPAVAVTKKYSTFAAPAITKQYTTVQSSPVYSSFVAQPAYSQQQFTNVKQVAAAPVLVKSFEQEIPVYSQQYVAQQVAQPVYSQQYVAQQVAQPVYSQYSVKKAAQQYSASSSYASDFSAPSYYRILSQVQETDPSGPYKLSYSTENGIQASEEGSLIAGAEGAVVAAQGSYSYTGPDGQVYTVSYIADDNGFRASGDHLPTPPPIPAEILKSLEENARSGEQYDEQGRLLKK